MASAASQFCQSTGGQLWERVEAGRFSEAQAARIIREILQLLAQAHSRNIVIRDIKPDNLLFLDHSQDSPLKAIDFGIATVCSPTDILEERCGKLLIRDSDWHVLAALSLGQSLLLVTLLQQDCDTFLDNGLSAFSSFQS